MEEAGTLWCSLENNGGRTITLEFLRSGPGNAFKKISMYLTHEHQRENSQ